VDVKEMSEVRVELRVLGHTELTTSGAFTGGVVLRQPKRLALLAYLAMATAEGFRRRDQIVAMFWPDQDQMHARTQLRKALYALRGVIGADALGTRGEEEVKLNGEQVWCDAVAFRRLAEKGEWLDALALYRGDLLEGLFPGGVGQAFEEWLHEQRASLRELAARAAWEASSRADLGGDRAGAIALARRALELVPDDEEGIRRLIATLDRHGDRAGALRLFTEWRHRLMAEFDAEPAPETRKLVRRVQAHRLGESMEAPRPATRAADVDSSDAPPVAPPDATPPAVANVTAPRGNNRLVTTLVLVGLVVVGAGASFVWKRQLDARADLAVLPFQALGDSLAAGMAAGLVEELSTSLARESRLRMRALSESRATAHQSPTQFAAARMLAVRHLVEGTVRSENGRFRVTVRLTRSSDARTLWGDAFDADPRNVIGAQETIARAVTTAVLTRVQPDASP
jgi:serine/threonine-protein kinase